MEIIEMAVEFLTPYENNPRNNDAAVDAVAASIREFGFKVPIIIDRDGVIVAGHTRHKAAKKLGMKTVPCIIADDLSPEQIKAFRIADNKTNELADWDMEKLLQEMAEIQIDMKQFGFTDEDIPEIDGDVYEDEYTEPEHLEPRTKPGQRFQLGAHVLMCGDSTKAEDVRKLTDGAEIDLLVTDPPYNVDYTEKSKMLMQHDGTSEEMKKIRARQTIQNDVMGDEEFREFLHNAFRAAGEVMRPGAAYYIWHSDTKGLDFRTAANEEIGQIREVLIWNKRNIVVGRQDYQWKHEPCLYGWKEGAGHYFINSRTEATVWEDQPDLDKITKAEAIELLRQIYAGAVPTTIIDEQQPRRSRLHPTMKPVALIGYQVANSSRRGEAVLDLFGGSGTTLIACQQLGRRCYMMEYDPHYCDVIIDRWEQFTGEKAVLL